MVSRTRSSYDTVDAPALASAQITPPRRAFLRTESATSSQDRAAKPQVRAAQPPLKPFTEPELAPERRTATKNRLTMVFLLVAVFLVAAATTFLQAYLRDHRSTAASTTRAILVGPSQDHDLEVRSQPQIGGAHAPEAKQDTSAPEITRTEREPRPRMDTPVVTKPSRERVPSRPTLKEINTARTRSGSVSRSSKPIPAETQVRRPSERQAERRPSVTDLPMNSTGGTQPSLLSQQSLPKAPEPAKSAVQSTKNSPPQPNTATNPASPGRESVPRAVPQSAVTAQTAAQPAGVQNSGYVPARPLKWAAPDAKSLGVSRISQAVDIAVKIRIDESGHVTSAHALLDGSIHDPAVMAAATAVVKQWTFEPAKTQGKNVSSEDTVVIHVDPKR